MKIIAHKYHFVVDKQARDVCRHFEKIVKYVYIAHCQLQKSMPIFQGVRFPTVIEH